MARNHGAQSGEGLGGCSEATWGVYGRQDDPRATGRRLMEGPRILTLCVSERTCGASGGGRQVASPTQETYSWYAPGHTAVSLPPLCRLR